MNYTFKSDKGKIRAVNQDRCNVFRPDDDSVFAIVCDGMGGASAGEVASSIAVETVSERVKLGWRDGITAESVRNLLLTSITAANINVYDRSVADPECLGMGTTVVACVLLGQRGVVAHAGDSRAYLCGESVRQITKDHSLVQELVDLGQITPAQARTHPKKNYITRALGVDEAVDIDFDTFTLSENEALLLCTDGLFNFISDDELLGIMHGPAEDRAARLVAKANENGGGDNITAVVISQN